MSPGARAAVAAVRGYQLILRPLLPAACRFAPSCSEYCRQAIAAHGLLRGVGLALQRVGRCHPWHPGGYDPPPPARNAQPERPGA
jgi:putative membrane protein insertion efficiency factor